MPKSPETPTLVTTVRLGSQYVKAFIDWQAELNVCISTFPGFISIEIFSSTEDLQSAWTIVQRFSDNKNFLTWCESKEHAELLGKLKNLIGEEHPSCIEEVELGISNIKGGVTEVFITEVNPEKEEAYRKWVAKIHQVEATFPGFRGMYVQAPTKVQGRNWITLLQFDTPENLDGWLSSVEREKVMRESENMITAFVNHRLFSPYVGWFGSIGKNGEAPPAWKQTMIVLLVLFPIVMLELKFLPWLTASLNSSLSTFIGNAISVTLIAWPMMPIAIWFLTWWLLSKGNKKVQTDILGAIVVLILYMIEIAIFWDLL